MIAKVDLTPQRLDVDARAGVPLDLTVPLVTEAGEAADLTGLAPVAHAVQGEARLIFTASIEPGSSTVRLRFSAADTEGSAGVWEWDLVLTSAGVVVASPVAGLLTFGALVTDVSIT